MLKERVRACFEKGENCSRIILQAAAEEYGIILSSDILDACRGLRNGFGIGGMCCGLVAAVMVLGLLFEEDELNEKRILFLIRIQECFGYMDCGRLSAEGEDCSEMLMEIAKILQDVIDG